MYTLPRNHPLYTWWVRCTNSKRVVAYEEVTSQQNHFGMTPLINPQYEGVPGDKAEILRYG